MVDGAETDQRYLDLPLFGLFDVGIGLLDELLNYEGLADTG